MSAVIGMMLWSWLGSVVPGDARAHGPACPMAVERLQRRGPALQVVLRNQAPYAINALVVHVAYADALRQSHQQGYRLNLVVPQHETMVYTTPPLAGSVVLWPTLVVSTECHMVRH